MQLIGLGNSETISVFVTSNVFGNNSRKKLADWVSGQCNVAAFAFGVPWVSADTFAVALRPFRENTGFHRNPEIECYNCKASENTKQYQFS